MPLDEVSGPGMLLELCSSRAEYLTIKVPLHCPDQPTPFCTSQLFTVRMSAAGAGCDKLLNHWTDTLTQPLKRCLLQRLLHVAVVSSEGCRVSGKRSDVIFQVPCSYCVDREGAGLWPVRFFILWGAVSPALKWGYQENCYEN